VECIGTLKSLRRYPVKSMAGEDLQEARVTFSGLLGDRVYAFVDTNNQSDFPWMTGRQGHELILFRPRWMGMLGADQGIPCEEQYAIIVQTPDGKQFRLGDEEFTRYLEKRFGRSLRLRFSERSMTDARPISILGMSSIRALSQEVGMELDLRRFRENFYMEWQEVRPYFEDELLGRELQIGETVALQVVKKNRRCVMTTLDPDTAQASPQIFECVSRAHGGSIGVYGAVLREGIVCVNDPIYAI
jgi:uncharacterized protein